MLRSPDPRPPSGCALADAWAVKAGNLQSQVRAEHMMMRKMCGVSLKDRRHSMELYSLLGVQSVADVVRCGRWRWFGHLEHWSVDDSVSSCRNVVVAEVECAGGGMCRAGRLGESV